MLFKKLNTSLAFAFDTAAKGTSPLTTTKDRREAISSLVSMHMENIFQGIKFFFDPLARPDSRRRGEPLENGKGVEVSFN